jgi:hypothetical protein
VIPHTETSEWKSFEIRVRRRRAERLVIRAAEAVDKGCVEEARECLTEARNLEPALPSIAAVERKLEAPPAPAATHSFRFLAALAAVPLAGALVVAAASWIRPPAIAPVDDLRALRLVVPRAPALRPIVDATSLARTDGSGTDTPEVDQSVVASGLKLTVERQTDRLSDALISTSITGTSKRPVTQVVASSVGAPAPTPAQRRVPAPPVTSDPPPVDMTPVYRSPSVDVVSAVALAVKGLPAPAPAPAAAPMPAAPPPAVSRATDDVTVRALLERYATAYNTLDASAAQQVFPGINRDALARAFSELTSQRLSLGDCRIDVAAATARASCVGSTTWTPRIGAGTPRSEARRWTFDLARAGSDWQIVSARVQNR